MACLAVLADLLKAGRAPVGGDLAVCWLGAWETGRPGAGGWRASGRGCPGLCCTGAALVRLLDVRVEALPQGMSGAAMGVWTLLPPAINV